MRQPATLFVGLCPRTPETSLASAPALMAQHGAPAKQVRANTGLAMFLPMESGEHARDHWRNLVSSPDWEDVASGLAHQPTVHLLRGHRLPVDDHSTLIEVTRDASVETRQDRRRGGRPRSLLAAPEDLPPTGQTVLAVWQVIGHPGRLLCQVDPGALDALRLAWGPFVETPRTPW